MAGGAPPCDTKEDDEGREREEDKAGAARARGGSDGVGESESEGEGIDKETNPDCHGCALSLLLVCCCGRKPLAGDALTVAAGALPTAALGSGATNGTKVSGWV